MALVDRWFWDDWTDSRAALKEKWDNTIHKLFPPEKSPVWFYETLIPPKDSMLTASVVSMLDLENPVVQSFTDGDRINTFVTLSSIPIPYSIFVFSVTRRITAYMTKAHFSDRGDAMHFDYDDSTVKYLDKLFGRANLHSRLKAMVFDHSPLHKSSTGLIEDAIIKLADMFVENYNTTDRNVIFKQFIERVDQAYAESLENVIEIK